MRPAPRPLAVIYHPSFRDFAGAEMVTAWTLQALRETHDVVLWAEQIPEWPRVDARFATSLAGNPPRVLLPTWSWRCLKSCLGEKGRLLLLAMEQLQLRRFDRRHAPAIWLGTYNETWLPSPGILYIHHPEHLRLPAPPGDWPRWRQWVFSGIQRTSLRLGLTRAVPPSGHRKLVNSAWTRQAYTAAGGGDAMLVYPPVPPFSEGLPWAQREDRVVMLGRWSVPKRLDLAIEIVAGARRAGASLKLAFVGFWHCATEDRRKIEAAAEGLEWIEWHEHCTRDEIMELAGRSRYGLHAMENEHFGIAVAELASAGCIVLVPDSGGPGEIVEDRRQIYHDRDDGITKLSRITRTPDLQAELQARARGLGLRFSPDVFVRTLQAITAGFSAKQAD